MEFDSLIVNQAAKSSAKFYMLRMKNCNKSMFRELAWYFDDRVYQTLALFIGILHADRITFNEYHSVW